ncbi:MAG: hypothetical protein AAF242_12335, partial [Bacteroidota bacterium]
MTYVIGKADDWPIEIIDQIDLLIMLKNQNLIIVVVSLFIAILINFSRLLITISGISLVNQFGLTFQDVLLRVIVMFSFCWICIHLNLSWLDRWLKRLPAKFLLRILINFAF